MRIIFMGTPDFAVPALKLLHENQEICCVVTQPDRPRGRGQKLQPSPVKLFALDNNLPLIQPPKIKSPEIVEKLRTFHPDLIIVVAFGQILSQNILDIPKFGCINLHASLLPKYRGAAPIERCLINGETITGVTTMKMDAGLDTGDILLQKQVHIPEDMILPELRQILCQEGANLLLETIQNLDSIQPQIQDNSLATYAPLLNKDTGKIDWNEPAIKIHNLVRGLYGGAFSIFNGGKFKIWRTRISSKNLSAAEFQIIDKNIFVGTGSGSLEILELQAPNSKKVCAADFINGRKKLWTTV